MSELAPFNANGAALFDVAPVPPEPTGNGFVNDTTWLELTVIAVVSPVWMSSELSLSPVWINPPGDVVVLFILDGMCYSIALILAARA
jgi:hypothetical protein